MNTLWALTNLWSKSRPIPNDNDNGILNLYEMSFSYPVIFQLLFCNSQNKNVGIFFITKTLPDGYKKQNWINFNILIKQRLNTYEDWNVCVSSCFNSPRWLMVKIRDIGIPTARYAQTSCKRPVCWGLIFEAKYCYVISSQFINYLIPTKAKF